MDEQVLTERVMIRIDQATKDKVTALAERERRSVANQLRLLIDEALAARAALTRGRPRRG